MTEEQIIKELTVQCRKAPLQNGVGDDSRILISKGSGEVPAWGVRIWTNNGRLYWGE